MLKKVLMVFGLLIAIILVTAGLKSPEMQVSREVVINASAEEIFPYINNSQKSYEWMPWAEADPAMEINFTGPAEGVGSSSNWNGKEMGIGKSVVVESVENQLVKTELAYTEPFAMSQLAQLSLTPESNGTKVTWSVSGQNNFIFRLMSIFIDCDEMIGGEFDKGLNKLKSLAEK